MSEPEAKGHEVPLLGAFMAKGKSPSEAQLQSFREDLIKLIEKHNLSIRHYLVEYDEFDEDSGYEIVRPEDGLQIWEVEQLTWAG